jgi:hypothetical protein
LVTALEDVASVPAPALPTNDASHSGRERGERRWRWVLAALVAAAVVVHLPAVRTPFFLDDYAQLAMADGKYPGHHGAFDLYDFIDDSNRGELLDLGVFPWWTDPHLVVRFLRPLSSLLLWVDHRVFGRAALAFHLHSLLWWGLACVAVHTLYRRCFSQRVATLAAVAFAVSPCHVLPLAWIANREALVSTALGAFALASYVRWREPRDKRRALEGLLSFLLFALALAAGEYTLCLTGYVGALELARRRESLVRRVVGLAPVAIPIAAYVTAHTLLRYGAHGGGLYHDPVNDPRGYLQGAPRRLAVLITSGWLGTDAEWWAQAPAWALGGLLVGLLAVMAAPVLRALRDLDDSQRTKGAWLLVGSFASLAPVLAVEPSRRLLGASLIGVCALAALVMDRAWFPPDGRAEPRRGVAELSSLAALAMAFVFFVRGPIDTLAGSRAVAISGGIVRDQMHEVRDQIEPGDQVVALRANIPPATIFSPFTVDYATPVRWRLLTYASGRSLLLRTAENAIELVASPHPLFPVGPKELFRNFNTSLRPGDVVTVAGMRVTIVQLDDAGLPKRLRFEFDRDLDDPSMIWVTETAKGFRRETLPGKGYGEPIVP